MQTNGDAVKTGDRIALVAASQLAERIVQAVHPDKIILFGSAARGEMKPSSDLDLLVIKAGDYHHIEMSQRIYAALGPRSFAVDITVATPEEVDKYRDAHCLVFAAALREGTLLYDAQAA